MPGPILGVFDSGFGGLTVLRALLPLIPEARYIYLGDTARLPYGAKSRETIARYAVSSARFLESRGAELLVIACNTATALALPDIERAVGVPVIGVVDPGAQAAYAAAGDAGEVLVLATAATVQSHAYREACASLGLHATEVACPLLVPLVEEGWTDHHVTREVLRIYLTAALEQCSPGAVLLGCTHYPLIAPEIERTLRDLGSPARVIDSAHVTAKTVAAHFGHSTVKPDTEAKVTFQCFATDSTEKFRRLGSLFLTHPIDNVVHLDLDAMKGFTEGF
ncbi:MAG TPA: glutamate racemase [Acidobacteriaceae bacterium]|jgi:glutamate racemase